MCQFEPLQTVNFFYCFILQGVHVMAPLYEALKGELAKQIGKRLRIPRRLYFTSPHTEGPLFAYKL